MTMAALQQHTGEGTVARAADQLRFAPTIANSLRVEASIDRLSALLNLGNPLDVTNFSLLCLSLSRGIDFAVANEEKPSKAPNLPALVKQICEVKGDHNFQAYAMVLLISVKNACKVGWFTVKESEEVLTLTNELARAFGTPIDVFPTDGSHSIVGTVMERFYPHMKIGHILTTLEVKPGYGVYTNDFHILKKTLCSQEDRLRLLVVQVDNLDTSTCIISPQQVNFAVNGVSVEKRNSCFMDTGPQLPTNVTPWLKYGTNLLQAAGHFNGNYVIVIAFMREIPLCDPPILQDHIQPIVEGSESDPELIEGPSRISLNCPISFSRIKLPVKGHLCKHLQCFDYSNFININSRRPSWRCPHCNQSVCYLDIRVDQNMVKVLKEVGDDASDVIISADGSWKAVFENDDCLVDQVHDTNISALNDTSEPQESTALQNTLSSVIDLAQDDDTMDVDNICGIEDIKPFIANQSSLPESNNSSSLPESNNSIGINQNAGASTNESSWQGLEIASGLAANARLDNAWVGEIPQPTSTTLMQLASVVPTLNCEGDRSILTAPEMQSHLPSAANFQSQHPQLSHSNPTNEYGTFPAISRTVSRIPIAVQALPARSQIPGAQRLRPSINSSPNSPNIPSQPGLSPTINGFNSMFENHGRFRSIPSLGQAVTSRPLSIAQELQELLETNQLPSPYRPPSLSEFQNPHLQQIFSPRPVQQPVRTSLPMSGRPNQQGIARASSVSGSPHSVIPNTVQRPPHLARQHPMSSFSTQSIRLGSSLPTVASGPSTGSMPVNPMANNQVDLTAEQNLRPNRMRGSLSGRDLSQFKDIMIQPTQSTQPARPPLGPVTSPPGFAPPERQDIADNRTSDSSQPRNSTVL